MGDVISWGLINNVKKIVKGLTSSIDSTLDEFSTGMEQSMNQLVSDVNEQVGDMQVTIESAASGLPAPRLQKFISESTTTGIQITLEAYPGIALSNEPINADSWASDFAAAVTKGVMVRYATDSYPKTHTDGTLAFTDEDLFEIAENGERSGKEKTHVVTGLTDGTKYYFTAFPYTNYSAYNEELGERNCTTCTWSQALGAVSVSITADYQFKPLGVYDVTLTPSAGGSAITEQGNGEDTVVFNSLQAGPYTLTFGNALNFNSPTQKSITVTAGQTLKESAEYTQMLSFGDCTWSEIGAVCDAGLHNTLFSVGDSKTIEVNGEEITLEIGDFNHDDPTSGGKAPISLLFRDLMNSTRQMNSSSTNVGGFPGSDMYEWLNGDFFNSLPADLRPLIKSVNKKTSAGNKSATVNTNAMKIWLLSITETGTSYQYAASGEGTRYPVFTTQADRVKRLVNGVGEAESWWARSPGTNSTANFCCIFSNGTATTDGASASYGVCAGFCI